MKQSLCGLSSNVLGLRFEGGCYKQWEDKLNDSKLQFYYIHLHTGLFNCHMEHIALRQGYTR